MAAQRTAAPARRRPAKTPSPVAPPRPPVATRWWVAGVALASALVFGAGFSSVVGFGDSAETLSGVRSLGVAHAPGYAVYLLAARAFTIVEPFGSLAFRVNLFSLVCGVVTSVLTFRIAMRLGAEHIGAAIAAIAMAAGASFWFYGTYAKAYAFTGMLLAAIVLLALAWKDDGGGWRLPVAGFLAGLTLGASFQVVALTLPGLALLLVLRGRRPSIGLALVTVAAGLAGAAAVGAYVLLRAANDPALNWGDASTIGRLVDLIRMKDFAFGQKAFASGEITSPGDVNIGAGVARGVLRLPLRFASWPGTTAATFGVPFAGLAVAGVVRAFRTQRTRAWATVAIVAVNIAGVAILVGGGRGGLHLTASTETIVSLGGFFLATQLVTACWIGLGATALVSWARQAGRSARSRAEQRQRARAGRTGIGEPARRRAIVAGALAVAVAWPLVANYRYATHRTPPFATDYSRNVLSTLPRNAVLLTWVAERSFPIEYDQIVNRRRRDVDVVRLEQIQRPWYREQVARRLGIRLPPIEKQGDPFLDGAALARVLVPRRPVYLDHAALYYVIREVKDFGYQQMGLVGRATEASGRQDPDLATMARLDGGYRMRGVLDDPARRRWPNRNMLLAYMYALTDYGSALANGGRYAEAARQFDLALQIDPSYQVARDNLTRARQAMTGADPGTGAGSTP